MDFDEKLMWTALILVVVAFLLVGSVFYLSLTAHDKPEPESGGVHEWGQINCIEGKEIKDTFIDGADFPWEVPDFSKCKPVRCECHDWGCALACYDCDENGTSKFFREPDFSKIAEYMGVDEVDG